MAGEATTDDANDTLVLEGIAVTTSRDGAPHIAPMGPVVDRALTRFVLRPFSTSQTFQNLRRTKAFVFQTIDDVELLARAAVGRLDPLPELLPTPSGQGWFLPDCCRWFELRVDSIDESQARVEVRCQVADQGRRRDFFGWNRAKHAVLEAAILATRTGILVPYAIRDQLARLEMAVEKTAGHQERRAMTFLREYIEQQLPPSEPPH